MRATGADGGRSGCTTLTLTATPGRAGWHAWMDGAARRGTANERGYPESLDWRGAFADGTAFHRLLSRAWTQVPSLQLWRGWEFAWGGSPKKRRSDPAENRNLSIQEASE